MKILVVFHTVYGHIHALANAVAAGVQEVPGVELVLRRAREFPENVQHMEQEKGYSYQVYQGVQSIPECTIEDLREADGVLLARFCKVKNASCDTPISGPWSSLV
jgi:NAD(P)H dehydrogenase (quinone)